MIYSRKTTKNWKRRTISLKRTTSDWRNRVINLKERTTNLRKVIRSLKVKSIGKLDCILPHLYRGFYEISVRKCENRVGNVKELLKDLFCFDKRSMMMNKFVLGKNILFKFIRIRPFRQFWFFRILTKIGSLNCSFYFCVTGWALKWTEWLKKTTNLQQTMKN